VTKHYDLRFVNMFCLVADTNNKHL